ncbi:MAG TPA: 8-amino-7-oxononanoate synthase [Aeromicrobium sp.]|nr:8-amino-7-oxononanoate synthase [Aeromicrobium sp.]
MNLDDWLLQKAADRQANGLVRHVAEPLPAGAIDLAGNDYLGFAQDPRVIKAAAEAAQEWGAGAGASRLVTGNHPIHDALEAALTAWTGRPAALAFSSGYHANLATITALSDADTLLISDAHVHASLVDGCRLSAGTVKVVPHNDLAAVEEALAERYLSRAMVIVESIYSVLGDAAPLAELADLCVRHDAMLIVDEAHGIGVAGTGPDSIAGRGLVHATDLADDANVVVTATLSKALGSQGGAVLASTRVVEHLVNTARTFIYDTGLAPAAAGAAVESLNILGADPAPVARLHEIAMTLQGALGGAVGGAVGGAPAGAVMSIPMPSPVDAVAARDRLTRMGVHVGCFRPPSTPDGISRLRLTASARLDDAELELAVAALAQVLP